MGNAPVFAPTCEGLGVKFPGATLRDHRPYGQSSNMLK